jgi:hypothetical protein
MQVWLKIEKSGDIPFHCQNSKAYLPAFLLFCLAQLLIGSLAVVVLSFPSSQAAVVRRGHLREIYKEHRILNISLTI